MPFVAFVVGEPNREPGWTQDPFFFVKRLYGQGLGYSVLNAWTPQFHLPLNFLPISIFPPCSPNSTQMHQTSRKLTITSTPLVPSSQAHLHSIPQERQQTWMSIQTN